MRVASQEFATKNSSYSGLRGTNTALAIRDNPDCWIADMCKAAAMNYVQTAGLMKDMHYKMQEWPATLWHKRLAAPGCCKAQSPAAQ